MCAGGTADTSNNTYYLYTNNNYRSLSPYRFNDLNAYENFVSSSGDISYNVVSEGVCGLRPVVSLTSTSAVVSSGDGTSTNPYVIQTS